MVRHTKEGKRLKKIKTVDDKLKCGEKVRNRQLQTWLSEDKYLQIEAEWQDVCASKEPSCLTALIDSPSVLSFTLVLAQ